MNLSAIFRIVDRAAPSVDPVEFAPGLLRIQNTPPAPYARAMLKMLLLMLAALLLWAGIGQLDIVAVADGKLVPAGYLKIVQPSEQGVVKEILVQEGQSVKTGQVLMRMDAALPTPTAGSLGVEYQTKRLALRRIDAQLAGQEARARGRRSAGALPADGGAVRRQRGRVRERPRRRSAQRPRQGAPRPRGGAAGARQARRRAAALPRAGARLREASKDGYTGR